MDHRGPSSVGDAALAAVRAKSGLAVSEIGADAAQGSWVEDDYVDIATRHSGSINVALFWDRSKGDLVVVAHDRLTGEDVRIAVDGAHAADAYRHPFAYAGRDSKTGAR